MLEYYPFLSKVLLGIEFLAALVGTFYLFKLKTNYWRWFSIYLIYIFIQEFFWYFNTTLLSLTKQEYYAFIGIPIQYVFFYWLFALKSLKKRRLFIFCLVVYISSIIMEALLEKIHVVYSISLNIGTIILILLVVLEFMKQIKNENILNFRVNKMFYINFGIIIFYVATYPFIAFYRMFANQYIEIWNGYYLYFMISNCLMYLLFIASFLWGKKQ